MNIDAKKLINSCATWWNSMHEMLERVLKLHWSVIAVLSDDSVSEWNDHYLDLKSELWKLVEDLVPVLEQFSVALHFLTMKKMFLPLQCLPLYMATWPSWSKRGAIIWLRDFKGTQLIDRFELRLLYSAHPMLMGPLLDPWFKHITLSK